MSDTALDMDSNLAKLLLMEGATLVIFGVPYGTDLGIDLKSWNTAENFRGIKMIPPGFHYVHYSAVNDDGEMAPKIGFLHTFHKKEILVKYWDANTGDLSGEVAPEETSRKIKDNLKEIDRYLGPYPYDIWKQWKELTTHISPSLVQRCSPVCGYVRSAMELEHGTDAARPRGGAERQKRMRHVALTLEEKEDQLLPDLKPIPGTELRLSSLPDKHYPDGATPTEITKHSLDTSYALEYLLNTLALPMEIIGEIQLAFVCFRAGENYDAFQHWKKLVSLLCGADSAIPRRRTIYMEFLKTLEAQLNHVPEDLLCDIVEGNNFVYENLRTLFANVEVNLEVDGRLKSYVRLFSERLTAKFLWDFSGLQEEAQDEAPIVVCLE